MKFGINTFLFTSPFVTDSISLFAKFRKWGFDSVEIPLENPSDVDTRIVRKALEDNGLVCGPLCAAMGPGRDLRGSAQDQQQALDYLFGLLDAMPELGAQTLVGPLYSAVGRAEVTPDDERKRQWETVVCHMQTIASRARQNQVRLAIEPLNRYETDFINTCQQALQLVADVGDPALGVHLDSYHMNIEEKFPEKAIAAAGRRLYHFHACGTDRGTPGNDHTNWTAIADALREVEYDGHVVIESFTTDVKVIAKAASIWRQFEPSQDDIASRGIQFLHSVFNKK